MQKGKGRPDWPLGEHLLDKGLELAFEDPGMAVRLARLGLQLSAFLEGGYDPFAAPRPKGGRRGKGRKKRV